MDRTVTGAEWAFDRRPVAFERYRRLNAPVLGGTLTAGCWDPEPGHDHKGTLLAIHGITANHLAWQWLAVALPNWRIIAPDMRGRGRSNNLPPPYGLGTHADDLVALLDDAEVEGPIPVLGHSMGGFVALVLAHRHPDRVRQLVLVDGGIPVELPPGVAPGDALTAVLGPTAQRLRMEFATLADVDRYWQQHPGLGQQWGPEMAAYSAYDTIGDEPHLRPSTHFQAMADDSRDIQVGEALLKALSALCHPAVFLRAERGLQDQPQPLFSADWAARSAADLPGLTVRDIPDSNHFTIMMSPQGSARVAESVD